MPFNDVPHPEMVSKFSEVSQAYTQELYARLMSLFPTPERLSALSIQYQTSFTGSLTGNPDQEKECEETRVEVDKNLAILRGLAKALSHVDPTVSEILRLGQVAARHGNSHVVLTSPKNFSVKFDPAGRPMGSAAKVQGGKGYQIWACDGDPNLEANWRMVAASDSCKRIAISGLNRSKINWLKIRAMRGNTAGPWSSLITLSPE